MLYINDIVILLSYIVLDWFTPENFSIYIQMFVFAFAQMKSSIRLSPLEAYIISTSRDRQRAIQTPGRCGMLLNKPAVWTPARKARLSEKGLGIGYSGRAWPWLWHSTFAIRNGAKAILFLRSLVAAEMTWNLLRKQSTFSFENSVYFPQLPLDRLLPDVVNCNQLGGVNFKPRRLISPTDSGDQGQMVKNYFKIF